MCLLIQTRIASASPVVFAIAYWRRASSLNGAHFTENFAMTLARSILLLSLLTSAVLAPAAEPAQPTGLNRIMTQIGATMVETYPIIVLQRELTEPEQQRLKTNLKRLLQLFQDAEPYIRQRSETYLVSYEFILDYLRETQRAIDAKNLDYARSRLYGVESICTSCHTQDTKLRTLFTGAGRDRFADDVSYAEFNFLTRNYDEAEAYFTRELRAPGAKTEYEVIRPLQRLIIIYAQIKNKPGAGADLLNTFVDLPAHTDATRGELKGWIAGLRALDAKGASNVTAPTFADIESRVREILGKLDQPLEAIRVPPDQEVARVWLTGVLYHYLNRKPPRDEIPKVLYWLAVNDRVVGYNYYFSLADLYLKECVYKYPDHPYARRCLAEYQEFVNFAYSGSGGSFIPPELKQELSKMKEAIDRAGAKQK